MTRLRYPQALNDIYNKHFKILPLYYGRPMVWHDTGFEYNQYRQIHQSWFMHGQVFFFYQDMIGVIWHQRVGFETKPVIRFYDEHAFYERLPISYGYNVGDTVQCITTGKQHVISNINWGRELWVEVEDMPNAHLSYDLYIPLEDDKAYEYHPFDLGSWEGMFSV